MAQKITITRKITRTILEYIEETVVIEDCPTHAEYTNFAEPRFEEDFEAFRPRFQSDRSDSLTASDFPVQSTLDSPTASDFPVQSTSESPTASDFLVQSTSNSPAASNFPVPSTSRPRTELDRQSSGIESEKRKEANGSPNSGPQQLTTKTKKRKRVINCSNACFGRLIN